MLWWAMLIEALMFAAVFTTILFVCYHGDRIYRPECIHNIRRISGRNISSVVFPHDHRME